MRRACPADGCWWCAAQKEAQADLDAVNAKLASNGEEAAKAGAMAWATLSRGIMRAYIDMADAIIVRGGYARAARDVRVKCAVRLWAHTDGSRELVLRRDTPCLRRC